MTLFEASLIAAFILSPLVSFLEPYVNQVVQTLTSAALHRKLIKAFLAFLALLMLIGFAVAAYVSFYWFYIPQRGHVAPVYLNYERPSMTEWNPPSAVVDFTQGRKNIQVLRSDQAYDISVRLHVPTSERNVALGNFMVSVTLLREDGEVIANSSRPSILTYQSHPLRLMKTAWKAVPLVLDWSKEDQLLNVPLIEHYVEKASNPVARAIVSVSAHELHIYSTSIHIDAHFSGLRYFMYYYKVPTALAFISVFIFWEIVFSVVTWQLLAAWFGPEARQLALAPAGGAATPGAAVPATTAGGSTTTAQPQSMHQLRAPTPYQQHQSNSRTTPAPRQPQLDDHRILETHGTDTEDEEELLLTGEGGAPSSSKGRYPFIHDEMEDDDDFPADGDEAVVPQRGDRPQAPASLLPTQGSSTSSATNITGAMGRQRPPRHSAYQEDLETATTSTTTSTSRRSGQNTPHLSMTSSTLSPPPPPPPSVLSEPLSSERSHQQHHHHQSRRLRGLRGIETGVTEEDFGGAEGDNEDDEDDDLVFGDDDFSETSLPASPPIGSTSVRATGHNNTSGSTAARLRRAQSGGSSSRHAGAGAGIGSS
ncbi:hypothetical protein BGZ73_005710 [Actinomortierella ambigua]|nr:hypothetical protein BGZ73_005710 [Actinomortierella ambigua]